MQDKPKRSPTFLPLSNSARDTVGLLLTMCLFGLSGCLQDWVRLQVLDDDDDTTEEDDSSVGDDDDASDDDDSTPPAPELAECGNDIVEEGEECDGNAGLVGESCLDDCTLDRSVYCPDGTITHRMPHNDSIWKENNTFLTRHYSGEGGYPNLDIVETRSFCVDLTLSEGASVYLQAVHQWGEELGGGYTFENNPRPGFMTIDVTPPPGSTEVEKTSEGESPLVGYQAAAAPSIGVWKIHLRDWSGQAPLQAWGREDVAYDILVQVVEAGVPFEPSQGVERAPICGDGEIHLESGEQCDDANSDEEDGCRSDCTIDTEMMCPGGVLDMIFDDPMEDNATSGLDNIPGVYGYEAYLDSPTDTRVHCVPVPHDQAIRQLTMKIYEDCEDNGWGTLTVTPPAGSGISSVTGSNEQFGCCGISLRYGNAPGFNYDFHETHGGVWIHSMTGANLVHRYWEFMWWYQ